MQVLQDKAARVGAVGLEPVCASWSRARRAPPGSRFPSAVRSPGKYIWGLPELPITDKIKTLSGNRMARHALEVIRFCLEGGIPGYLENPQTSMLFQVPGFRRLLKRGRAFLTTAHMCQYGVPWRKATTFLVWGLPKGSVELRKCSGSGRCSATGKQHLRLSGTDKQGFLTRRAQEYPRDLATHLMQQILT